jgi:hypothetical protein
MLARKPSTSVSGSLDTARIVFSISAGSRPMSAQCWDRTSSLCSTTDGSHGDPDVQVANVGHVAQPLELGVVHGRIVRAAR